MALRRLDPKAVFKLVSVTDEAVDMEKSDLPAYARTGDMKHVAIKDGEKPTVFHCRQIDPITMAEIDAEHIKFVMQPKKDGKEQPPIVKTVNNASRLVKIFRASLLHIEEEGKDVKVQWDEFPSEVSQEIGSYVNVLMQLGHLEKKS